VSETPLRKIRVSPSDFAFILDDCPRCSWFKYALQNGGQKGILQPRTPFPSIFSKIDWALTGCLFGLTFDEIAECVKKGVEAEDRSFNQKQVAMQHQLEIATERKTLLSSIHPSLPDAYVFSASGSIVSQEVPFPDLGVALYFQGQYDILLKFLDGRIFVVDLKTTEIHDKKKRKYSRQLHSYGFSLAKPAVGDPMKIDGLALIVWEPERMGFDEAGGFMSGPVSWMPVEKDQNNFKAELLKVAKLVARTEAPTASLSCDICRFAAERAPYEVAK
jgi:hypothetical protein